MYKINSIISLLLPLIFSSNLLRAEFLNAQEKVNIAAEFKKISAEQLLARIPDGEFIKNFYHSNNFVFELHNFPNIIFKIGIAQKKFSDTNTGARFFRIEQAVRVIKEKSLDRILVPKSDLLQISFKNDSKKIMVIAEEKLQLAEREDINNFHQAIKEKNPNINSQFISLIDELAIFICAFGDWEYRWNNNPLIKDEIKITLVDLDFTVGRKADEGLGDLIHPSHQEYFKDKLEACGYK